MSEAPGGEDPTLFPKSAGERLREAREAQGLSLAEIAARTRIPIRQLEAIENGEYGSLPSITYAVGFAKSYARAVGVDEVEVGREIRGKSEFAPQRTEYQPYEMADPSRTPSRGLVIGAVLIAVLIVIAAGLYYGTAMFRGNEQPAPAAPPESLAPPAPAANPAAVTQGGQVTLTATDEVWLRVYDATGKTLFLGTMKPGDHYDVPGDANNPMINVGRPDKLQVTVNGSSVPALGSGRVAIKDIGVSAAALAARTTAGSPPATSPTPAAKPGANASSALPPAFTRPTSQPTSAARREPETAASTANDSAPAVSASSNAAATP